MRNEHDFTKAAILPALLKFALPVLLGQKLGEGRPEEAGRAVGSGICLFAAVALAVTVVMLIAAPAAFLMSRVSPGSLFHLGLSTPASTVVQIMLCMGWFWRQKKRTAVRSDG